MGITNLYIDLLVYRSYFDTKKQKIFRRTYFVENRVLSHNPLNTIKTFPATLAEVYGARAAILSLYRLCSVIRRPFGKLKALVKYRIIVESRMSV